MRPGAGDGARRCRRLAARRRSAGAASAATGAAVGRRRRRRRRRFDASRLPAPERPAPARVRGSDAAAAARRAAPARWPPAPARRLDDRPRSRRGDRSRPAARWRRLGRLHEARRRHRRAAGFGGSGACRRASCPAARSGRRVGERRVRGHFDAPLPCQTVDELPRDDFLDGARRALHLDAVVALQQRDHFLARGVEQLRDFVNPDCCQIETSALSSRLTPSRFRVRRRLLRSPRLPSVALSPTAVGVIAVRRRRRVGVRPARPPPGLGRASRPPAPRRRRRRAALEVAELLLDLAALLFLALDVDLPACQLRRETDVLPLLADRERQLLVLDDHFHHLLGVVHDRDALHLRRADRVGDEERPDPPTTRRCRSSRRAARG